VRAVVYLRATGVVAVQVAVQVAAYWRLQSFHGTQVAVLMALTIAAGVVATGMDYIVYD
jgi:hypothetical protein